MLAADASRYAQLPPGVHVAPFRSRLGRIVLLAITPDGRLDAMTEVVGLEDLAPAPDALGTFAGVVAADGGDADLAATGRVLERYGPTLLGRGVHTAPWVAPVGAARTLLIVDGCNRLAAMTDVGDDAGVELYRTLGGLLFGDEPTTAPRGVADVAAD